MEWYQNEWDSLHQLEGFCKKDEKNMEQQISVQDNDIILSVRTSDDMAKDILENLEKLAADKLTEEQYQAGDRMQVNNKKDELARLLKITAVRIEDVLEQVEDIAEARIEFYEALSQLDVLGYSPAASATAPSPCGMRLRAGTALMWR